MQCTGDRFSPAFAPQAATPVAAVAKKHRGGSYSRRVEFSSAPGGPNSGGLAHQATALITVAILSRICPKSLSAAISGGATQIVSPDTRT